jgi:predicted alpha/beta-hydrolase family hydrolase
MTARPLTLRVDEARAVSGLLHVPAKPSGSALILAHGAGTDMTAPLLVAVAEGLAARGVTVLRFNFLYKELGKKAPDAMPKLELVYRTAIEAMRAEKPKRLFVGGKSMGGRVASMLAAKDVTCDGLVFLGYPLHPAGKPEKLRAAHLAKIKAPLLFVSGTRDPLCDLTLLRPVLAPLGDRASLHLVDGGEHSFDLLKSAGRTRESVHAEVITAIHAWIAERSRPAKAR